LIKYLLSATDSKLYAIFVNYGEIIIMLTNLCYAFCSMCTVLHTAQQ